MFKALFGSRFIPSLLNIGELFVDLAMTMATLFLGRQGSGKTFAAADTLVSYAERNPRSPVFILDWSGSLTDAVIKRILSSPKRDELIRRLVYDPLGGRKINNTRYVVPLPEFSQEYDPELDFRELVATQSARVVRNFERANDSAISRNPTVMGRPITKVLPHLLELTYAIPDEAGEGFQITETEQLLNEEKRNAVIDKYGGRVPNVKKYFEDHFPKTARQQEFKTDAIGDVLTIVEHDSTRARLGFPRPGWTPKKAFEKGLVVIIDASDLMTREPEQDYLILQVFSLIMAEVDKRRPGGNYPNVIIAIDEAYSLLQVPGVANQIARLPAQYRNKGLCLVIVIQTLNQLASGKDGQPGLRENIWSFGNIAVFALLDKTDCEESAYQFFAFDRSAQKLPANTRIQHPVMFNISEQVREQADRIQHFRQRECYVRRFLSEAQMDSRIRYVDRTREVRITCTDADVENLKDQLVRIRGVEMDIALKMINKRQSVINKLVEEFRKKEKQKKETKKRKVKNQGGSG